MTYFNYFLRCLESDKPNLLALGVLLGVLQESEGQHYATSGDFVVVNVNGCVYRGTGEWVTLLGEPVEMREPVRDGNGNLYWHANLRTTANLRERAEAMAIAKPEIAEALAQLTKYFVTDEFGQPKVPSDPAVVWAV